MSYYDSYSYNQVNYSDGYFYKQTFLNDSAFPIYWEAYRFYYSNLWKGIKEIYSNDSEIRDLCYHRALSAFYWDSDESNLDRQILLYHYMKKDFNWKKLSSLLNEHKEILPIESSTKTILSDLCLLYDEEPKRTFYNNALDKTFQDWYREGSINSYMQDIYELAQLSNVVCVAPVFKQDEETEQFQLKLIFKSPDMFRIWTSAANKWKVTKLVYPDYDTEHRDIVYHEWTDATYRILDREGKQISERYSLFAQNGIKNPYGKIPFAFLRLRKANSYLAGGRLDMVFDNLRQNKVLFASELVASKCGFPIPFGVNLGEIDSISPDKLLGGSSLIRSEDIQPDFRWISPENSYTDLLNYYALLTDAQRIKFGIPIGDSANISGISRVLARQKLLELRKRDIPALSGFEKELAQLIKTIAIVDGHLGQSTPEMDFTIEYSEERVYNEPDIERTEAWTKVTNGELPIEDYYYTYGGLDKIPTAEQLESIIKERMETYNKIKPLLSGKTEEPAIPEPTDNMEDGKMNMMEMDKMKMEKEKMNLKNDMETEQ